jgi:protein TonB
MNPTSEGLILRSILTFVTSIVLVFGGLALLTSTALWAPRQEVADGAAAPRSGRDASEVKTQTKTAFAPAARERDADRMPPAVAEGEHGSGAPIVMAQAESDVSEPVEHTASVLSPSEEEAIDASSQFAEPEPEAAEGQAIVAESMMAAEPGTEAGAAREDTHAPDVVAETEATDSIAPATPVTAVETAKAAEPASEPAAAIAPETTQAAELNTVAPVMPVAVETAEAAPPGRDVLAETPSPVAVATETMGDAADNGAPAPAAAAAQSVERTSAGETVEPKAAEVPLPPPPLPNRKPKLETPVAAEAARSAEPSSRADAPKQAKAAPDTAQQAPKQTKLLPSAAQDAPKPAAPSVAQQAPAQPSAGARRWFPMTLAPADKPLPSQAKTRVSSPAYASSVWAALARHKPKAGQSGSATVVFSIGAGGALNGVRIGKSSGNSKIDQLALATVRGAAPFSPPPSGPASFSIRIDF